MIKMVDTEEEILKLDQLRLKSMKSRRKSTEGSSNIPLPSMTYYAERLLNKEYIGLSLEKDGMQVAGCILSDSFGDFGKLCIEHLFTDPDYQGKGYETELLNYIEKNIGMFDRYYSRRYKYILTEPEKLDTDFYKGNGYHDAVEGFYLRKKIR